MSNNVGACNGIQIDTKSVNYRTIFTAEMFGVNINFISSYFRYANGFSSFVLSSRRICKITKSNINVEYISHLDG